MPIMPAMMRLRRLEIQGFKTFAARTVFEFLASDGTPHGVTGVIGPNGSGKSNTADAVRWAMGEQSLRLIRSRKAEDVIFSGTPLRARSGFAEVTLTLQNDGHVDVPYAEVAVTRRLYRDGESEYEINKQKARLSDVHLLLAQCGVGQRTYSVIGQGMVDAVLAATPSERRGFFDEASGIKPFQLKRDASVSKLEDARDKLAQADLVRQELEPRLASLERQVKRLRERDALETELKALERRHYGSQWGELRARMATAKDAAAKAEAELAEKDAAAAKMEEAFRGMETAPAPASAELVQARAAIDGLREERAALRERQVRLEVRMESAVEIRKQRPWAPLPLSRILDELQRIDALQEELLAVLMAPEVDLEAARKKAAALKANGSELLGRLQQPAPEPAVQAPAIDPELQKELEGIVAQLDGVTAKLLESEARVRSLQRDEEAARAGVFQLQRELAGVRGERNAAERRLMDARVELARQDARREAAVQEVRQFSPALEAELDACADEAAAGGIPFRPDESAARLQRLRSQLAFIGGIDPETVAEYESTNARVEEMRVQMEDLRGAIAALEKVVDELDRTIKTRSEEAFAKLNVEFGAYFKKLFGGGEARLIKVEPEVVEPTDEDGMPLLDAAPIRVEPPGIDIQATPPGKRLKSVALLSGGERSLTAIALICAIMAVNPAPFVVLDEVDAALDEANARKFADIVVELADKTQFVVVTHNRHTMHRADVLYGVTLAEDGTSQVLSLKLEDVKAAQAEAANL